MTVPVLRRYTLAAPAALDVFSNLTDDVSGQSSFLNLQGNTLLDMVMDPDPAAGLRYEFVLTKNGRETDVRTFSSGLSSSSAGRQAIGPVSMSNGNYIWKGAQRSGAVAATSCIVKYGAPLN